ncbi:hypothetical protein IE53DRAFT_383505 [Violaceomyces palustris]|uniref:Uncharacterized protein n=1 Tax=Violaceomyces palustris TaxID=1673888 RepID=A0ACD0P7Q6_9BASI|nr:hypothetical protein IE53DRAFT_383505 [Violaceomyces palustris]
MSKFSPWLDYTYCSRTVESTQLECVLSEPVSPKNPSFLAQSSTSYFPPTILPSDPVQDMASSPEGASSSVYPESIQPDSHTLLPPSRRPSVQRTTSVPVVSSRQGSLHPHPYDAGRPSITRSCSESVAAGVLERRRKKAASCGFKAPGRLVIDIASIPVMIAAANSALVKAARKAALEPAEWDWGCDEPESATSSSSFSSKEEDDDAAGPSSRRTCGRANFSSSAFSTFTVQGDGCATSFLKPKLSRRLRQTCPGYHPSLEGGVDSEWDWALGSSRTPSTSSSISFNVPEQMNENDPPQYRAYLEAKKMSLAGCQSERPRGTRNTRFLTVGGICDDQLPSFNPRSHTSFIGAKEHAFGTRRSRSMERKTSRDA